MDELHLLHLQQVGIFIDLYLLTVVLLNHRLVLVPQMASLITHLLQMRGLLHQTDRHLSDLLILPRQVQGETMYNLISHLQLQRDVIIMVLKRSQLLDLTACDALLRFRFHHKWVGSNDLYIYIHQTIMDVVILRSRSLHRLLLRGQPTPYIFLHDIQWRVPVPLNRLQCPPCVRLPYRVGS